MDDHKLSKRAYIDHKTGEKTSVFLYRDKPCPDIELTSPLARRYGGYSLIRIDLLDAQEWLKRAHDLVPDRERRTVARTESEPDRYFLSEDRPTFRLIKSLWYSAIVLYGKCYASAEGRKVKLERSNLPNEYLEVHDKVITFRNTIVAHAGETAHESAKVKLVLSPNPKTDKLWLRADISRLHFEDDRDDPFSFAHLVDRALENVDRKIEELRTRLLEKEVFPLGKEHWYKKARGRD